MVIAFIGGNVIDGTGSAVKKNTTVVINNSKIVELTSQHDFGDEVHVVDVSGKTVMPGLIDSHMHFGGWNQILITQQKEHSMFQASKSVYSFLAHLEAGCTASRDHGGLEAGFVKAQAQGLIPGPRLQTALVIIQPTNGLLDNIEGAGRAISPWGLVAKVPGIPTPWADGPWECRAKVRECLRYGADFIKIAADADYQPKTGKYRLTFSPDELEAIVDEAHHAGVPVACHALGHDGAFQAVKAGVDSIEHVPMGLDQELADEIAKKGIWMCATLTQIQWWLGKGVQFADNEYMSTLLQKIKQSFTVAQKAGVRIVMGTDIVMVPGSVGIELKHMCDAGMTPMQAIEASTRLAAECIGLGQEIGTLEVGKEADLLIVDGDPLNDVGILANREKLLLVMQAGKPVSGPIMMQFPWQPKAPTREWPF